MLDDVLVFLSVSFYKPGFEKGCHSLFERLPYLGPQ